jgi:hypothetical protein
MCLERRGRSRRRRRRKELVFCSWCGVGGE